MLVKLTRPDPCALQGAIALLEGAGARVRRLDLPFGTFLVAPGLEDAPLDALRALPGVAWARAGGAKPILAARDQNPGGTRVRLGRMEVGGEALALVAGPCSVEDRDQILATARYVAAMAPLVDCFQVGARNMSNAPLLRAVGRAGAR